MNRHAVEDTSLIRCEAVSFGGQLWTSPRT